VPAGVRKRAGYRIPRISSISISITSEFKNCQGHRRRRRRRRER